MAWGLPFNDKHVTGEFGTRSAFRIRNGLGPHRGVDWAPGDRKTIHAVTDGKVELIKWSNILGWVMVQSSASGKYYIGYAHLSCAFHGSNCKGPSKHKAGQTCMKSLKEGDKVELGQVVGRVGNTGKASSGSHLHATLGKTVKSVFYGKVYDLKGYIKKQLKNQGHDEDTLALSIRIEKLKAEKKAKKAGAPAPASPSTPVSESPQERAERIRKLREERTPKPTSGTVSPATNKSTAPCPHCGKELEIC